MRRLRQELAIREKKMVSFQYPLIEGKREERTTQRNTNLPQTGKMSHDSTFLSKAFLKLEKLLFHMSNKCLKDLNFLLHIALDIVLHSYLVD